MNNRLNRKKNKKRRILRIILLLFVLLLIGGGIYGVNVYNDIANAVDKMHKSLDREKSEKREEKVQFDLQDPLSILVVGIDEREGDSGRTDSMLVLTINPDTKSTNIVSIPRDTRTELIDEDGDIEIDKMNHAYAFGGIEMTIRSIEHFLNIPIDYYAEVNMEGFRDIVDAVGGIDVDNKHEFELDGTYLSEGKHHLDGEEALQYARMRNEDPLGDFGRQERQREVISKVIDKGASLSTLTNYDDILDALEDNIKTNLTLNEIIGIQMEYKSAAKTIKKLEIEGEGKRLNDGIWYFLVEDEVRQTLSDELRTHLGLSADSVDEINISNY
ncbi:LCP family glycopolymer transferase [Metabacillus malikii]|uniref:LCP family protein required for cell wall assembly n=1 Tax=Metabacillus malikii TaxID=1504265 RepID=A0ABT9ZGL5_9BACI|nr:LCP family protein [Metabacillus malikii]MDQ0231430.1 LCP family protein required for cell wall assembly [Metabacillus malikii]